MFEFKNLKNLYKALGFSLVVTHLATEASKACTTFSYADGTHPIVAKNYDWDKEHGLIYVNKRGVTKHSLVVFPSDRPLTWKSQYGSVTFNQYGRELPNAGMNEAGLVVEVMQLDSSQFEHAGSNQSINESQWVQYILDNASSVSDLKNLATKVRISKILVPLHYMACDQTGACVAVEILRGRLQVSEQIDRSTKVLANDTYQDSISFLKNFDGFGGRNPAPSGHGSLERFVRAAFFLSDHSSGDIPDPVATGFDGLAIVHTPTTQWSIIYDIHGRKISFKSRTAPKVKTINLKAFDYDCAATVKSFPVIYNESEGDVTPQFAPYSHEDNAALVRRSLAGDVPENVIQAALSLPETTSCER